MGRSGAESVFGAAPAAAPDAKIAEMFAAAAALHRAGALTEAERQYRAILKLIPAHADAQGRLGAVLMAQGKTRQAIDHLERAVALKPDLFEARATLAQAHMAAGDTEAALRAMSRALELKETVQTHILFAQYLKSARFAARDERVCKLALRALAEGWGPPRELTAACISLIKASGVIGKILARINVAWPARLAAAELFGASGLAALSGDPLLGGLLKSDPISDVGLERLLTSVRLAMLTMSETERECEAVPLDFFCAVARQCFIGDYVFSLTAGEADAAERSRKALERALASSEPIAALLPVVVSAYFPLHSLSGATGLLNRAWPESVAALLAQQIEEPLLEGEIAATMPALTAIDDAVSLEVRRQYEENPYPRWVAAGERGQHTITGNSQTGPALDVLIAGCGTGLSTIESALQAPRARILAIDLSRASLGYAKRIAQKLGLANIAFAQADILNMNPAVVGHEFDVIDASGVLHHLADPWAGWRALLSLLRPGGTMQICLYSALARQNVVAARALIAERGFRPVPQDIRRCREEIMAAEDGSLLQSLSRREDFFTTNECRDLLFHVQEHRLSLPEIEAFLTANNLIFTGFFLNPAAMRKFAARFPQREAPTDLKRWHEFEIEAPETFAAMYQFQVRKPAAAP